MSKKKKQSKQELLKLFRAVNESEFEDILKIGKYRLTWGVESKYFAKDEGIGTWMAKTLPTLCKDGLYTRTHGRFGFSKGHYPDVVYPCGEGEVYVLTAEQLPHGPVYWEKK